MPQFSVNPERFDPYKNFKFRIKWDGRYVARAHLSIHPKTQWLLEAAYYRLFQQ